MKKSKLIQIVFILGTIIMLFGSCSAIGLGIGHRQDKKHKDEKVFLDELSTISNGTTIYLVMKDGTKQKGNLIMLTRFPEEPYLFEYVVLQKNARGSQPNKFLLADIVSLKVKPKRRRKWIGLVSGLVLDFLVLRWVVDNSWD